jgi:hypothetical protein
VLSVRNYRSLGHNPHGQITEPRGREAAEGKAERNGCVGDNSEEVHGD